MDIVLKNKWSTDLKKGDTIMATGRGDGHWYEAFLLDVLDNGNIFVEW